MRRIDFISFSPGVACRWVPHHHHLRDVAELAEVLLQPLLCCLPGEATDEHLSGDGKHRYLFRQGAPLVNPIPSGFHAAAPNIVNNAGFLTLGHWSGHRQMRLLLLLQVQASFSPLRRRSRKQLNQPVSTGHADAMELRFFGRITGSVVPPRQRQGFEICNNDGSIPGLSTPGFSLLPTRGITPSGEHTTNSENFCHNIRFQNLDQGSRKKSL